MFDGMEPSGFEAGLSVSVKLLCSGVALQQCCHQIRVCVRAHACVCVSCSVCVCERVCQAFLS